MAKRRVTGTKRTDLFVNFGYVSCTQSAATVITFEEWNTGYSLDDDVGIILHRLEYNIGQASIILMLDNADSISFGLVTSSKLVNLALDQAAILDKKDLHFSSVAQLHQNPVITDFSSLPEGGILVAPKPLYLAVDSISIATAATVSCRVMYTVAKLTDRGFRELWQSHMLVQ